jgi:eukaryotic-like serine/threonine-protein kinase
MVPYDKSTWDRIRPAVDSALDLEPEERGQYLSALRTTDPELAALVEQFLSNELSYDDVRLPASIRATVAPAGPISTLAGMVLGSYVLDRLIGRGGMGQVWLAHRADGRFEGQVAVKLLNLALIGSRAEKRFKREGNILAKLAHPNIARLIDAGISEIGQPYLVLEYIEGIRIDEHCDSRTLSIDDRVRLVLDVLDAVSSAHANLIVHRDLKPANVLVTNDGTVKLLDFGIAKLLEGDDDAELTAAGGRALTPEYAAPEQILSGSISTSTDVYAAGVMLFRLLCGVHPTADGAKTSAEYFRATIYGSQLRLSDAVMSVKARTADDVQAAAARRGTSTERLAKQFRGDLDNILACALKRDAGERYQSIGALADDLRRYLRRDVVSVRADSAWYRFSRFALQNRSAVTAAGIVAAVLVGATIVSRNQMRLAEEQRDDAQQSARFAQATGDVALQLLSLVETDSGRLTPDARLAQVQKMVDQQYRNEPRVHAAILAMLADRYGELNDLDKQVELQLLAASKSHLAADSVVEAQRRCIAAWVLYRTNRTDSATAQLATANVLLRGRSAHAQQPATVACNTANATRLVQQGQFDSAVTAMRQAVQLTESIGDTVSSNYTVVLNNLGQTLNQANRPREAVATVARVNDVMARHGETNTEGYILVFANRASSLVSLGEFVTARDMLEGEIRRVHPAGSTAAIPMPLLVRSIAAYQRLGTTDSVRRMARIVVADSSRSLPPPVLLDVHVALAESELLSGNGAEAHRMAAALAPMRGAMPPRPRAHVQPVMLDAELLHADGKTIAALDTLQRFARSAGWSDSSKADAWLTPILLRASEYALTIGNAARAATLAHDAFTASGIDSLSPKQSGYAGDALLAEAAARLALQDTTAAIALCTRGVTPLRYGYGPTHPRVIAAEKLLAALKH